jgi:hypothetical protein
VTDAGTVNKAQEALRHALWFSVLVLHASGQPLPPLTRRS